MGSIDALAAPFGEGGSVIVSGENLAAIGISKVEGEGGEISSTYVALIGNPEHQTPFDMPRLAVDAFVTNKVSIGGSLTYIHNSSETKVGGVTTEQPSVSGLFLSPRVGFGTQIGNRLGLWVRGGVTYYRVTGANDTRMSGVGINIDPLLMVFLNDVLALGVGPSLNVPLSGSVEAAGQEADFKLSTYGLTVGLHGVL